MAAAGAPSQIRRRRLATLKCRKEFLSVRKGNRCSTQAFVLEGRQRTTVTAAADQARFGFTVARAVGGAVERNRIRRRLKAAVKCVEMTHARSDFDYVLVARRLALASTFAELIRELTKALERVNRPKRAGHAPGR